MVMSIDDSVLTSLYHLIQKVFSPALVQSDKPAGMDPKLQNLITELEAGLGTTMRRTGKDSKKDPNAKEDNLGGKFAIIHLALRLDELGFLRLISAILSPLDEFQFWEDQSQSKKDGDRAGVFATLFKPLLKNYSNLESLTFEDFAETLELTHDTLDEVWKSDEVSKPYSEPRMKHLMEAIGSHNPTAAFSYHHGINYLKATALYSSFNIS